MPELCVVVPHVLRCGLEGCIELAAQFFKGFADRFEFGALGGILDLDLVELFVGAFCLLLQSGQLLDPGVDGSALAERAAALHRS